MAAQQASGSLPWNGVEDPSEAQRLQADHAVRLTPRTSSRVVLENSLEPTTPGTRCKKKGDTACPQEMHFKPTRYLVVGRGRHFGMRGEPPHFGPEQFSGADDPRHALQSSLMDDGDILCHPILVPFDLQEFDVANAKVGAERNPQKTEVIQCTDDPGAAPLEWRLGDVQNMANVSTVTARSIALGVAVGSGQYIADQLSAKADVTRAMHERVQLCQDPQTEYALLRESPGVSRVNHILRVHDHTVLQEQRAAAICDEVGQRSLERLFPGFTEDSKVQAPLTAGQSGIGYKRARATAASGTLGSTHSSLTVHPSNEPRCSRSWPSAEATP